MIEASIMKQSFEVRKVAGLSKYLISSSDNVQNVDNIVLLGDTDIVKLNGT